MDEATNHAATSENAPQDPLTRIRAAYTLAATDEHVEAGVEELMIRHFIETLAEIALSIASRNLEDQRREETDR